MSSEQTSEVYGNGGSDNVSMGDRPAGERVDNREFRRNRHRECYCRGRNKNCPKCQGTGQLLPNWRENLQAARQNRPQTGSEGASVAAPVSRDYRQDDRGYGSGGGGYDRPQRSDRQDRPSGGGGGYGGGNGGGMGGYGDRREGRRDRWQNRRDGGGRGNRNNSLNKGGKVCPMCGEFVPNLRAHVLARHDDPGE
jgi:hypothetical protein